MRNVVEASCRVYQAKSGSRFDGKLRFDVESKTFAIRRRRINLSDLAAAPREVNGNVELVSKDLRILTKSPRESRDLMKAVAEAGRLGGGAGAGGGLRMYGDDSPQTTRMKSTRAGSNISSGRRSGGGGTPRTMAFEPSNTLHLASRPPASRHGGKRGQRIMSLAAAPGGVSCGAADRRRPAASLGGTGIVARSSGVLRRTQGVEGGGKDGSRVFGGSDEELSEVDEVSNSINSGGSTRSSIGTGARGNSTTTTLWSNLRGGGGRRYGNSRSNISASIGKKAETSNYPARNGGGSPLFPPLVTGPGAAFRRSGGTHGYSSSGSINNYWKSRWKPQPTHYLTHRESVSRREGFRNMGNTCYVNASLQGLLSLSGFVGDLRRKCWVLAMLKPPPSAATGADGDDVEGGGGEASINIRDATNPRTTGLAVTDAGGGAGDRPSLYDALLRLSLEAKGPHGLMDASPLKRAMDSYSDRFAGNLQQDAHEFLSDLVNVLHDETQARLAIAAENIGKPVAVAGEGRDGGKTAAAGVAASGAKPCTKSVIAARNFSSGDGGGVAMVDLSSTSSEDDDHEEADAFSGGWSDGEGFAAAAEAAAAAVGAGGSAAAAGAGSTALEALEVDSDGGCVAEDLDGATGAASSPKLTNMATTMPMRHKQIKEMTEDEDCEWNGEEEEEEEEEEGLGEKERLMPTTRHFHAEVEAILTCTRCSYSRRRRELYRDFSLDIPEAGAPQQEKGGERGGTGASGSDGVFGLEALLEGFFQPSELSLRCERCGHDRVRAEHAFATLPGALVLHIKRFKAVMGSTPKEIPKVDSSSGSTSSPITVLSPPPPPVGRPRNAVGATGIVDVTSDTAAATVDVDSGDVVTTPPVAIVGGGSTGASSRSSGGGGGGGGRSYGGVSYVKLTAPVSVPPELDLERFCSAYTGNAPAEDLGERVDSLEGLGIPPPPSVSASSRAAGTGGGACIPATPKPPATPRGGGDGGGKKRPSDEISVDLSMREGWSYLGGAAALGQRGGNDDVDPKRFRGEVAEEDDIFRFPAPFSVAQRNGGGSADSGDGSVKQMVPGTMGAAPNALWDSTNSGAGGGSKGVRETIAERRRRVAKEKENSAVAGSVDRWEDQGRNSKRRLPDDVILAPDGTVNYLDTLSSRNKSSPSDRFSSDFPQLGGRGGGSGKLVGDRPDLGRGDLRAADRTSAALLARRETQRRAMDDEEKQLKTAIAASKLEAFALEGEAQEGEDAELARAIGLSQAEGQPSQTKEIMDVCSGGSDLWACSRCTLDNDGGFECEVCCAPRPEAPPPTHPLTGAEAASTPPADSGGRGVYGKSGEKRPLKGGLVGGAGAGRGGGRGSGEGEEGAVVAEGEDQQWTPRGASPLSTDGPGGKQESPEPEPEPRRVRRTGPLRARYELRGVLHHLGQHAFAGHYVTDVREKGGGGGDEVGSGASGEKTAGGKGDGWERHDDSFVAPVTEAKALGGAARRTCYVCFYSLVSE